MTDTGRVLFPEFDVRSLSGVDRRLPRDLPAQRTLLLLPFQQWQQRQVDAWIARAEHAGFAADLTDADRAQSQYAVIEVPCLSRRWGPVRRFIDGGMTAGIRVPIVLARTWTAYTDVGRVQRALGIADSAQTWVGVVAAGGEVLAHRFGEPDDASWRAIAEAMRA